ncbi:MAG: lipoprotein [Pseudomonadales bacterium]
MRWIVLFIMICQVTMCGQKGPLELPERSAQQSLVLATGAAHVVAN